MEKHEWTFHEEYICCDMYLRFAVFSSHLLQRGYSQKKIIDNILLRLHYIPVEEIKEKLRYIKQINIDCGFKDNLLIEPLEGYSMSCKRAFAKAVDEYLEYLGRIDPRPLDAIRERAARDNELADENGIILLSSDVF